MKILKHILFMVLMLSALQNYAVDIWVSISGSDQNQGTKEQPLATLNMALRHARELRRLNDASVNGGINIIIKGGNHQLFEPVFVRPEDSGTAASPTIIQAAPGEQPVISGGMNITGWHRAINVIPGLPITAKGKVWVADAPVIGGDILNFRQLWVNGQKATRAKSEDGDKMSRILSWDHKAQTCWIPKPKTGDLSKVAGMEMLIHQMWAVAILRIKSITVQGDSAKLSFEQPESRVQSEHPWPAPFISKKTGNSAFYLTNAIQFLNQPGEWYLDRRTGKVYYWPRTGEDLTSANVVAPSLETLVKIEGTIDNPVSYISFKGISFEYATWLLPSRQGLVPHQAGMYMLDAYKLKVPGTPDKKGLENQAWVGRPAAAVQVSYAHHTGFEACRFEHLASTGLDYVRGTHDDEIKGNLFKDIGGTGIVSGVFSDEAQEVHLPYNPKDVREICTNEHISNNLITDVANEDWGCVGIGAGYVKGININHNDVSEVSYTGISVGWGWTKTTNAMSDNQITANKISRYAKHMYDVAGIYTLSAQAGTVISQNYVDSIYKASYPHDPHHWFYLYLDEGSSNITVKDNWTPGEKFMKNANGPGNVWENNGPMVDEKIKASAGLIPEFQYLLKYKATNKTNQPINYDEKK
jgi:hypothetical protein